MAPVSSTRIALPLRGAGGEPVAFAATVGSRGLTWLPPNEISAHERGLTTTLLLGDGTARRVAIHEDPPGTLAIDVAGRALASRARTEIARAARAMFGLDDDLAPFYTRVAKLGDDDLAFASVGIGRMLRSPTAFEDVIRTICTTNCAWSATERMIGAIVGHLGTPADARIAPGDWRGRAFPTPA